MEFVRAVRIELAIFFVLFLTYSYFHQGGGWIQNSRFDQVRSIVEDQQLEINNYMIYRVIPGSDGTLRLRRFPLPPELSPMQIAQIANTGDISLYAGRIYPNKPPGPVLAASPVYFAIYYLERLWSIDPDEWWPLTINAYLTTVFSVGLLAAVGGVSFYRTSLRLFPSSPLWAHAASTLTFGLGTLVLPFATMLYDHDMAASLCLMAFALVLAEKQSGFRSVRSPAVLLLGGLLAGLSVLASYAAVMSVFFLSLYAGWVTKPRHKVIFFLIGVIFSLALLAWYHKLCFGSFFANANTYQAEIFKDHKMFLFGMFGLPRLNIMMKLLFSGYRGLFFTSPVLFLSFLGFCLMIARKERRVETVLFVAIFVGFLMMNSAFNNWHSGWSVGPRYLIPALPFLSLPLTLVFQKLPRITAAVAAVSVAIMLLTTAVDPQPPVGIANPFIQYVLPLAQGKTMIFRPFDHPAIRGPVSANPMGSYEPWVYQLFPEGSTQRRWNSFNLGEFLWPGSLWSVLPLFFVMALGLSVVLHWSRIEGRGAHHRQ